MRCRPAIAFLLTTTALLQHPPRRRRTVRRSNDEELSIDELERKERALLAENMSWMDANKELNTNAVR